MSEQTQIPEGYKQRRDGSLVPVEKIKEQDLLRDQLVMDLINKAKPLNAALAEFKKLALQDIEDLVTIAGERYDVFLGGKKGNVSLLSFDGRYKVTRGISDNIRVTESIEACKALVQQCTDRWKGESRNAENLAIMAEAAFRTTRNGSISVPKLIELTRLEIDDPDWKQAMVALRDALIVDSTSVYVRMYERIGDSENWKAITLDLASAG